MTPHTTRLAGRDVHRIGYGAMQLGDRVGDEDAVAVLRHAVAGGVDHIDTAQFYGDATVNRRIRAALHPYPEGLVLATKVGAERVDGAIVAAQRPEQLRRQVEANLTTLGAERLPLVNLRRMDSGAGIVASGDQVVDLDDQLAELDALRTAGLIESIGLSNVGLEQLEHALPAGIACAQNEYNVLSRADEPLLAECAAHGVAWIPFFPLGSAFDARAKVTDRPEVRAIADRLGVSAAQVGLAWLLAHDEHVALIPGTSTTAHLDDNLAVQHIELDAEAMATLDGLAGG